MERRSTKLALIGTAAVLAVISPVAAAAETIPPGTVATTSTTAPGPTSTSTAPPQPTSTTTTTSIPPTSSTSTSSTTTTSTSTSTSTTTTTSLPASTSTTRSEPGSTTSTTTPPELAAVDTILAALPPDPRAAAVAVRASSGPPDVATSALMPSDSVAAATAELEALRTIAARLAATRPALEQAATLVESTTVGWETDDEMARAALERMHNRRARAVLAAARGRTTDGRSDLDTERALILTRAATRALERRLDELATLRNRIDEQARAVTVAVRQNLDGTAATDTEIAQLTDKLTSAEIARTDPATLPAADPGFGVVAKLAREAEMALVAGDDTGARHQLAAAVGAQVRRDGAEFDAAWASTPPPARRAVYFALSQVGKDYVYATTGPDTYDCSGLTRRAWQQSGISLPHFSGAQLHNGFPVAPDDLRPGDLLTYGPDGADHVVLYLGLGFDVEAKGRAWGVVIEAADTTPAGGRFAGASRPLP